MKLGNAAGGAHLTYCTNIHRGETWAETRAALERHLPAVKRRVAPNLQMGVGLRLSNVASEALAREARELAQFKAFLAEHGLYVFTINGFPYGPFHGTRVKEDVYQPDWRFPERLAYSNRLADLLLALLPEDAAIDGSISTVPATFRPLGATAEALQRIQDNLLQHAAHLVRLRQRSGRTITLALEPEPMCYLETSDELVPFLEQQIFAREAVARFALLAGLAASEAEAALRRHVGICYDVCHAAIEFEDPAASIARLRSAGIGIFKLQLSAALKVPSVDRETLAQLRRFDEGVYLHQVVERRANGELVRYLDLAPAFAAIEGAYGSEWRVHCHVPVFMDKLPVLNTTQDFLAEILSLHKRSAISPHLEVETYTFDVLPEELRRVDVAEAVARELDWVMHRLSA
jgi:sugar phosphate isomerase/epimerase